MANAHTRKIQAQKTVRRPGRKRNGSGLADDGIPDLSDLAPVPEEGDAPKAGRGTDPFSRYLENMRAAGPLLTKAQELQYGRLIAEHVCLAIEAIERDILAAEAILEKSSAERAADPPPKRFVVSERSRRALRAMLAELNPDGLEGPELHERLLELLRGQDGMVYFKTYAEPDGCDIADRLTKSNLRLVVTMAKRYDRGAMPLPDLVQEGNLGLLHAVLAYDYRRGFRFSTYACWWIRHAIGRAIADKARTIRIPVHMVEFNAEVAKARSTLQHRLGRFPSPEEIAAEMKRGGKRARLPDEERGSLADKIRAMANRPWNEISLDQRIRTDDNDGDTMHETMAAETEEAQPWDSIRDDGAFGRLRLAMTRLSAIELDVIRYRFGLADDEERTFKEIGDKYHLSRERIRQIQNSALQKLAKDRELRPLVQELAV